MILSQTDLDNIASEGEPAVVKNNADVAMNELEDILGD
jgi:hypothetical protein